MSFPEILKLCNVLSPLTRAAPVVGAGSDGGSNVVAATGGGGGLADWVSVLIGAASLFVAVFATWIDYKTYQWQKQDRRGQRWVR